MTARLEKEVTVSISDLGIDVQVINLDRSVDRMQDLQAALDAQSISFRRLSATDGHALTAADRAAYRPVKCRLYYGRPLTAGEIGCYRSHLRAAKSFLASGQPFGLVLEDDVAIPPNLTGQLSEIIRALKDDGRAWILVNVGNIPKFSHRDDILCTFSSGRALSRAPVYPKGTFALLWSRSGAQWFLDEGSRIYAPVDQFLHSTLSGQSTVFAVAPPLVPHADIPSVINEHEPDRKVRQGGMYRYWFSFRKGRRKKLARANVRREK